MPHVSLRVSENEKVWMESYAKLHGLNLSEAIKLVFFEKMEDEYDISAADEAYAEYKKNPVTYTLDEVEAELGLR